MASMKSEFERVETPEAREERKKKWYLDIKNTPCARSSLMNGIFGGVGLGVAYYFLRGGIVRKSCDTAVVSFTVISLISWTVCHTIRYQKAQERAAVKRTLEILNKQNQNEEPGVPRYQLCLDEDKKLEK